MASARCCCDVDISSQGEAAMKDIRERRSTKAADTRGTSSLRTFFEEAMSPLDNKITTAELAKVSHAVKHHQSYRGVDCGVKVDREVFSDSLTANGTTWGQTNAKALCLNVLGPYSVQIHTDSIKENNQPFSAATNVTNKGTTECFPIALRYFPFEEGIHL